MELKLTFLTAQPSCRQLKKSAFISQHCVLTLTGMLRQIAGYAYVKSKAADFYNQPVHNPFMKEWLLKPEAPK
jgi:hypothetical protein